MKEFKEIFNEAKKESNTNEQMKELNKILSKAGVKTSRVKGREDQLLVSVGGDMILITGE